MKIAVVGATGLVGRKVVNILLEKKLVEPSELVLYASKSSKGQVIECGNEQMIVEELVKKSIKKFDYVLFCAGSKVAIEYAQLFVRKGAKVIDNSSAFRRDKDVPLVVPEINIESAKNAKIIANPNCSTIGASLPIYYLSKLYKIRRIIVSTYQAVSGAGMFGIQDLQNDTNIKFKHGIRGNVIPQIDYPLKNGYTFEEDKMNFELKKILGDRYLKICATCVRIPLENCHSESINIEFDSTPDLKLIKNALKQGNGVCVVDDLRNDAYPMPKLANGKNEVLVGRIRRDTSNSNAINMFICFDNLLKGASLNAVQIVEYLENMKN